jgi:Flp pilus assembly protein TadD
VAAANIRMLRWEEAETELQDALRIDDKDAKALANLIAVCLHLGKPYRRCAPAVVTSDDFMQK